MVCPPRVGACEARGNAVAEAAREPSDVEKRDANSLAVADKLLRPHRGAVQARDVNRPAAAGPSDLLAAPAGEQRPVLGKGPTSGRGLEQAKLVQPKVSCRVMAAWALCRRVCAERHLAGSVLP